VGTVFDRWARRWRKTPNGEAMLVRFADDVVVGFEHRGDALRFLHELRKRFAKFGLELHPDKTCLIQFGRFVAERRAERRVGRPETFDYLAFAHICAKTRDGRVFLNRITSSKRMRAKLKEIKVLLKHRRHEPIPVQGMWLASVVRGHCAYYAVPGNISAVMHSGCKWSGTGSRHFGTGACARGSTGLGGTAWRNGGSRLPKSCTPAPRCASPPTPEVGAECSRPARSDLCEGPPARAVPTAIATRDILAEVGLLCSARADGGARSLSRGGGSTTRCCPTILGGERHRSSV